MNSMAGLAEQITYITCAISAQLFLHFSSLQQYYLYGDSTLQTHFICWDFDAWASENSQEISIAFHYKF